MAHWQHYHTPSSVEEALALLAHYDGQARVVAGGTDLLIDVQYGGKQHAPLAALVDVTRIPLMTCIDVTADGFCTVGAAATHTQITRHAALEAGATCLVEGCSVIGGPQVRNVATLGGNVAHALPAGDGTTALVALDAEALVAWGEDGQQTWHPIAELYAGPGVSALNSGRDVLVAFRFALAGPGQGSAAKRVMRPQGVALPVLGCAVWLSLDAAQATITNARVCLAPVTSTPSRATAVEDALRGARVADLPALLEAAEQAAHASLRPRTSKYRATAGYRTHLMGVLLRGALPLALERARTGVAVAAGAAVEA